VLAPAAIVCRDEEAPVPDRDGYDKRVGWIGAGRMGAVLAERLLRAGCDVAVYNRTRAKAEPLEALGATLADTPAQLADRDIVITMVSSSDDLLAVTGGANGVLSDEASSPALLIDCSTVSVEGSEAVRRRAEAVATWMLAAPVSGNPKVARAGRLSLVASGPREGFDVALPYLELLGRSVTYVGEGEAARLVKICHNLLLGIVAQSLAEFTVLAERGGVRRVDLLHFINDSVMGSMFTRYKTPAFVHLDYTPTFTGHLLLKDLELGLDAARRSNVPLPVTATVAGILSQLIDAGSGDLDFASLLELEARSAGLTLSPEDVEVDDGLSPIDDTARRATERS
jgi:3-hydroxyisobutyrate dehydrogenase-like beta-hydroxyacid dehydrogenase